MAGSMACSAVKISQRWKGCPPVTAIPTLPVAMIGRPLRCRMGWPMCRRSPYPTTVNAAVATGCDGSANGLR